MCVCIYIYMYVYICRRDSETEAPAQYENNRSHVSPARKDTTVLVGIISSIIPNEPLPLARFGRYKTFVYFKAFVHERSLICLPLPICIASTIAILLHSYRAIYDPLPTFYCVL